MSERAVRVMDDNENYLELSKMNFSPFTTSFANVNVNQFAKFTQNLTAPSHQMLSLVPGSDGNVQFLSAPPQLTSQASAMNPTQTYITLPITIPPSKPGDATQTFQIQVLNPNPVPPQPKFHMGHMQIPIQGLQQHGTTVLTVAYSPQDGEVIPNQMPEGAPVTVLAAIQPQDLHLLAQQNGLAAHQQQQHQSHSQTTDQSTSTAEEDLREKIERAARLNIKAEPFWSQSPLTLSNPIPSDLSEFFQARNVSLQPYLKLNTDGIKKELFSEALAQLQMNGDNNNVISINNNFNADSSNLSEQNDMDSSQTTEINEDEHEEKEGASVSSGKSKKKNRKMKKKTPKPKRVKPGQVHIATAIDGTILFCCPECQMAYPEKESLESHLAVHKIDRRYICDICGAGLKRKEHLERHKLGHNPERPYVCPVCQKGFKRKEHLNLHSVIHSGQKTEICAECGKGFYRKDHLRKHLKSHQTKRAKEQAAHVSLQEAVASNSPPRIKKEKHSSGSNSPNTHKKSSIDTPAPNLHYTLPQEVTIHVTSNNTTLPVQIQLPQLVTTTKPDGTTDTVVVKMPNS